MTVSITPFLMFQGQCEAAITAYVALFPNSSITSLTRHGEAGPGKAGSVAMANFSLDGLDFMALDSAITHAFGFTPSFSTFVVCDSEAEIDRLFAGLSDGGEVLMGLDNYGFSKKFGWCNDRFGVSWQLNLA